MLGDGQNGIHTLGQVDDLAALHGAVAVAVAHDAGAAALHQLGEIGIVVLGAGQDDLAAELLLQIGLAGLELLRGLPQIGQNQVLGTCQRHQLDHMELIAGDGGVVQLAVVADLVDETGNLVLLLDSGADRIVRHVDAEVVVQLAQHVHAQLLGEMLIADLVVFEGDVGKAAEEIIVVDDAHILDGIQVLLLQVLLETAGGGAGLGCHLGVQEVEAALQSALHQASCIVTYARGHIVGRDVGGCAARRSQADGEAAGQVEKDFRHKIAGIADGAFSLGLGLLDQVVVGFLKQILKVDQMLEIFHR